MPTAMNEKELMLLFGIIILILQVTFAIIQFIYHAWTKAQTEKIVTTQQKGITEATTKITKIITLGIKSFDKHLEKAQLTHDWVHQIKEGFKVQQDGIPLVYRNTQSETIMGEITKTMQLIATAQKGLIDQSIAAEKNICGHLDQTEKNICFQVSDIKKQLKEIKDSYEN